MDKYTNLASQVNPFLTGSKAIVYVDFVQDVSPLAISLRQNGLSSCSYHGDKMMVLESWIKGEVHVMVCTSAFGMGIDQPDVDKVIRIGAVLSSAFKSLEEQGEMVGNVRALSTSLKAIYSMPSFGVRKRVQIDNCKS